MGNYVLVIGENIPYKIVPSYSPINDKGEVDLSLRVFSKPNSKDRIVGEYNVDTGELRLNEKTRVS